MIDISEDQESMNSSIAPQKSKKGLSSIINIQPPNPGGSVISIKQTNVNISVNPPPIKKEDKKKEGIQNISTIQNFAFSKIFTIFCFVKYFF